MNNIIEVKDLVKKYGNKIAVNKISFNVKKGTLFSFLGSNGAGKTTTISMLTTSLKRDSGTIIIDGINIDDNSDLVREKIGIVFQSSYLDGLLTVKENLNIRGSFYYNNKKELNQKVASIIKLLKLEEYSNQRVGLLSGGEKRRVDIARALLHSPKILFLDEPTTGLDPANRKLVWEIIKKLQKDKKITVFLTTHYMAEADESDIVGIIDKGKLIELDSPNNLKLNYTNDILKIRLKDKKYSTKIKEKHEIKDDLISIRIENSIVGLELANKYKEYIKSIEIISGDMDDVFLNITGSNIKENS